MSKHPKLTILRHAKTGTAATDFDRPLSSEGKKQCLALQKFFKEEPFDLALTSSAPRAVNTADLILVSHEETPIISLEALYLPLSQSDEKWVQQLIDKPYRGTPKTSYLPEKPVSSWERHSLAAYHAVYKEILKAKAKNVLIIAHLGLVNTLGLCFAPDKKELNHVSFAPCAGFCLENGKLTWVSDKS